MTLTQTWIRDQITRGCSITGIPFQLGAQDKTSSPQSASLDRIDVSNPNQTIENTRVVLHFVNNCFNEFALTDTATVLRAQLNALEKKVMSSDVVEYGSSGSD